MGEGWSCRSVALDELLRTSFEEASRAWRGAGPVVIATPVGGDLLLLNLLSPRQQVFWTAAPVAQLSRHRVPANPEARAELKRLIKGVPKPSRGDEPGPPYGEWLNLLFEDLGDARASSARGLCAGAPALRDAGRRRTALVTAGELDDFIARQQALAEELGGFAFLGVDEQCVMLEALEPGSLRSAFLGGLSPVTFSGQPEAWEFMHQRLLAALSADIARLERGGHPSLQMEPLRLVNPVVQLRLPPPGALRTRCEPLLKQVLSCRARWIRLLGWPGHLPSAWSALGRGNAALPSVEEEGIAQPFDVAAELKAFVTETSARYPLVAAALGAGA